MYSNVILPYITHQIKIHTFVPLMFEYVSTTSRWPCEAAGKGCDGWTGELPWLDNPEHKNQFQVVFRMNRWGSQIIIRDFAFAPHFRCIKRLFSFFLFVS
jgi:hypothetical protein